MQHHKGCFDREVVNKLPWFAASWIREGATGARGAHAGDVLVHVRPIEAKADAMEGADDVEMAAGGIAVKRNEDDVPKDSGDDNQPSVGIRSSNGLAVDEEVTLPSKMRLAKACAIAGMKLGVFEILICDRAWVFNELHDGIRFTIVLVRLGPREVYAYCAVKERLDAGSWGCNLMWLNNVEIV